MKNFYPTEQAAQEHANLLPDRKLEPIQITWWGVGCGSRHHAYALKHVDMPLTTFGILMNREWRIRLVQVHVGAFLPPRETHTDEHDDHEEGMK